MGEECCENFSTQINQAECAYVVISVMIADKAFISETDRVLITFRHSCAGLPDGIFSYQKFQFGKIIEDLSMEDVGIFYGHYIGLFYGLFGIFYGHWIHFSSIWYIFPVPRKIWQPWF
jgi:hypothetical protein